MIRMFLAFIGITSFRKEDLLHLDKERLLLVEVSHLAITFYQFLP